MSTSWKPLGLTDEQPLTCERCGKRELRRLAVLEHLETGETMRVGTTCASHLLGSRGAASEAFARAHLIQRIADRLRADGLQKANEWRRLRGIAAAIERIGNPMRNIWRLSIAGQVLIVTDSIIRRDLLADEKARKQP